MPALPAFALRRMVATVPAFLAATMVVFAATFALPGDPARALAGGRRATPESIAAVRAAYHLDEPLVTQYLRWLGRLVRGDLGQSLSTRRPVGAMLAESFPVTLRLVALTFAVEAVIGIVWGAAGALRPGGPADRSFVIASALAIAAPAAAVGPVLQLVFGVRLGWLPVAGADGWTAYLLPALTLSLSGLAIFGRVARAETALHLGAPHVRTARGKGLSPAVVARRHVVRCGVVPLLAFGGVEIGALVGGTVLVERIFNLPGAGRVLATAISERDVAVIVGGSVVIIAAYLVLDVGVDLAARLVDPRLR